MGYFYGFLAALLFGANGSVAKLVLNSGLNPAQVTQVRTLGTALIAGVVLLVIDHRAFRIPWRQLGIMAVLGVVGLAVLQVTYAIAIDLLPVGIALLIQYLAVPAVALVGFLFLKEQVKARLWVAIGCVVVGLAVVAQVWASTLDPLGVVMALAAAATLAVYFIVGERQVTATSPLVVAFWTSLFATLVLAPFSGWWLVDLATLTKSVSLTGRLADVALPLWAPVAFLIVLGSFMPFVLSFSALGRLKATAGGIVASSEVIFAFVVAWLWLGEQLSVFQLAGAAIVLAGIVLAQTSRSTIIDADLALAKAQPPS